MVNEKELWKLTILYINSISISLLRWHISPQINRLEYILIGKSLEMTFNSKKFQFYFRFILTRINLTASLKWVDEKLIFQHHTKYPLKLTKLEQISNFVFIDYSTIKASDISFHQLFMCPPSRRENDGESDYPNRQIDKSKPRPLQSNLFVKALCLIKNKTRTKTCE